MYTAKTPCIYHTMHLRYYILYEVRRDSNIVLREKTQSSNILTVIVANMMKGHCIFHTIKPSINRFSSLHSFTSIFCLQQLTCAHSSVRCMLAFIMLIKADIEIIWNNGFFLRKTLPECFVEKGHTAKSGNGYLIYQFKGEFINYLQDRTKQSKKKHTNWRILVTIVTHYAEKYNEAVCHKNLFIYGLFCSATYITNESIVH